MIAVIDDTNTLIYVGQCKDELPSVLLEQDIWGVKSIYRHIEITERPPMGIITWDEKNYTWKKKPELSLEPAQIGITDDALMKENEALKQRLVEQERQMSLIKSHLGL